MLPIEARREPAGDEDRERNHQGQQELFTIADQKSRLDESVPDDSLRGRCRGRGGERSSAVTTRLSQWYG